MPGTGDASDPPLDVEQGAHCTTYDVEREAPSLVLVEAIAAAKDTDPFDLDPVGNAVDLDALDAILRPPSGDQVVEVAVDVLGVRATIDSGGTVVVHPSDE